MAIEQDYISLKERLKSRLKQLEEQKDWLFVLGNTMRAMIVTTDKSQLDYLDDILVKRTS